MSAIRRNNVRVSGAGSRSMVFAHGFGCDQNMWRHVAPAFEADFKTVLFDSVGAGGSDLAAYDPKKYATLDGYADDVIEILRELDLTGTIFVGHSVSAMIGVLASLKAPELFSQLILIGPSPRYIDDDSYVGGFGSAQIEELLEFLDRRSSEIRIGPNWRKSSRTAFAGPTQPSPRLSRARPSPRTIVPIYPR
jgi:sigma-B regulation protein RsbQ